MTKLQALLQAAASQVGYAEGKNNDTKFGAWYGMNFNPWCMMFVSWCAHEAGISYEVIPKMAYCPYAVAWFQSRNRFTARGTVLPQAGDVIFFTTDGKSAAHVGIVEKVSGGQIFTIEGNKGDKVSRCSYAASDRSILGWGRPDYEQEEKMEISDIGVYLTDSKSRVTVRGCVDKGVTYIRLRDAEKLFPVSVGWDEAARLATVSLNYNS